MTLSPRPPVQMFEQLFGEEQATMDAGLQQLKAYLSGGGSIFPLVRKGVPGLVREYALSEQDAQRFVYRTNALATYVRRRFLQRDPLAEHGADEVAHSSGLLSLVDGPQFERIFPQVLFEKLAPANALESSLGVVAYLIDLLLWIKERIEAVGDNNKILLHDRRKDLKNLEVDFNAVFQSVSSVDIITRVLEDFIKANEPDTDVEDALIKTRYPNGLPYYQHWVTIDGIAQLHRRSTGDFDHAIDPSYPNFLATLSAVRPGRALTHASRLGPYQRELLTETAPGNDTAQWQDFYRVNFGTDPLSWMNLNQVRFFGERTKLDTLEIERLVSVGKFAPVRSPNVTFEPSEVPPDIENARSGSVYINANRHPGVSIVDRSSNIFNRLSINPGQPLGRDALNRMNRKVRLDNWMQLPSEQVDAVLAAAMRAEARGNPALAGQWLITDNVVHALGLFQLLKEGYECSAADFVVFLDNLSVYGQSEVPAQFDQVFNVLGNRQGEYSQPLKLDGGSFPVVPPPGATDLTISRLCAVLNIKPEIYQQLAAAVARAHNITGNAFTRSAPILSSFYRLVKLPRLLGIEPEVGVRLLHLLGGTDWVNGLAGIPVIAVQGDESADRLIAVDILTLITAMHACRQWCERSDLPVKWVVEHAEPLPTGHSVTERELAFFEEVRNLLPAAMLSDADLLAANVPAAGAASWLHFLSESVEWTPPDGDSESLPALVSTSGLVLAYEEMTADEYLIFARKRLAWAVDIALGNSWEDQRDTLVSTMLNVLLQATEQQVSVVKQKLAFYAGVDETLAVPVLNWVGTSVCDFLQLLLQRTGLLEEVSLQGRNTEKDPLIDLLADVRRRSAVVSTLQLNAAVLQEYLDYGYRDWLAQTDRHTFSLNTLYYLTTLTHAFGLGEQPEQTLLDYLREVAALPPSLSVHAKELAYQVSTIKLARFYAWSVQDVRECVTRMDPVRPIPRTLKQLDLLMRVRELSAETGMDALTVFLLGGLPETVADAVSKNQYAVAAELALLSRTTAQIPRVEVATDLKALVSITCVVTNDHLIANKPGEKATYTVTLKNAEGAPMEGVTIYWQASLGKLENGVTDRNGIRTFDYIPSGKMGTERPMYWLDQFEPWYAPPVNIEADFSSMQFPIPFRSPVPSGVVPAGQEVELYATMMDKYGNLGQGVLVNWTWMPMDVTRIPVAIVRPRQGYTDQEGLARVFVSSTTGGRFIFSLLGPDGGPQFGPITFEGDEVPE